MRQLRRTALYGAFVGVGLICSFLPTLSHACAVCGAEDNGYFWGVLFLMSMPFAIGSFVGGWLLYSYRRAPSDPAGSTSALAAAGCTPLPGSAPPASGRYEGGP